MGGFSERERKREIFLRRFLFSFCQRSLLPVVGLMLPLVFRRSTDSISNVPSSLRLTATREESLCKIFLLPLSTDIDDTQKGKKSDGRKSVHFREKKRNSSFVFAFAG